MHKKSSSCLICDTANMSLTFNGVQTELKTKCSDVTDLTIITTSEFSGAIAHGIRPSEMFEEFDNVFILGGYIAPLNIMGIDLAKDVVEENPALKNKTTLLLSSSEYAKLCSLIKYGYSSYIERFKTFKSFKNDTYSIGSADELDLSAVICNNIAENTDSDTYSSCN